MVIAGEKSERIARNWLVHVVDGHGLSQSSQRGYVPVKFIIAILKTGHQYTRLYAS